MKKLLLLGGSRQQICAIECAREKGYYTVLCDYLPDNPGQKYADKFYCVSTTDIEEVLKVARKETVNGVLSYASDPAAPTAAYIAEQLGLPTSPYDSVKILANKELFREFLAKNNFCTPKAKGYQSVDEAKKDICNFKLPVVIKPVDSSGSKGVSKLTSIEDLDEKTKYALSFSREKRFIIEEYVEKSGYQVAGDGFSIDGKLVFYHFGNDHFDNKGVNPYVPISASFPLDMTSSIQSKIRGEIQRLLYLLNMKTGAYNFDIRVDNNENVYLMEIGPRNGGNYIPQVIKYATGVDLLDLTIRAAMGEYCEIVKTAKFNKYCSYYAIHSYKSGILKNIEINEQVRNKNVIELHMNYNIGDAIPAFTASNSVLGIIIMKFESMDEMLEMMDDSEKWIKVNIK